MKINNYKKQKGFALLYIMIIASSVIVAFSLAANKSSFFSANRLKAYVNFSNTRMIASYCGDNLLMQIRNTPALTSSGTLSFGGGSCSYNISGSVPNKTITITASKDNVYKKITITTTQIYPTINAVWVEGN